MNKFYLLMVMGCMLFSMAACTDDTVAPTPTVQEDEKEEPEMGTIEKLSQTWVLKETYSDDVQQTSDGTGEYLFTAEGAFFFNSNGSWNAIGAYEFVGSDSSTIAMLFTGTTTPVNMDITTLSETQLNTEFYTNGKTLRYNYVR